MKPRSLLLVALAVVVPVLVYWWTLPSEPTTAVAHAPNAPAAARAPVDTPAWQPASSSSSSGAPSSGLMALPPNLRPTAGQLATALVAFSSRDGGSAGGVGGGEQKSAEGAGTGTGAAQGAAGEGKKGGGASLNKEDIKAAVKSVVPHMKHCYESGQKMTPESQGKVTMSFTLVAADGGGFMRDAEIVNSDLGNPIIDACLIESMTKARFPMPQGEGEVRVTYPLQFAKD